MAKYRVKWAGAVGHAQGDEITDQQIKDAGHETKRLVDLGAIEPVGRAGDADDDEPRAVTDEGNKLRIEKELRDRALTDGPLPLKEQDKVAADVTRDSAKETAAAQKDAAKEQRDANAARAKADAAAERGKSSR